MIVVVFLIALSRRRLTLAADRVARARAIFRIAIRVLIVKGPIGIVPLVVVVVTALAVSGFRVAILGPEQAVAPVQSLAARRDRIEITGLIDLPGPRFLRIPSLVILVREAAVQQVTPHVPALHPGEGGQARGGHAGSREHRAAGQG